jgi:Mor family transcriptional regulator
MSRFHQWLCRLLCSNCSQKKSPLPAPEIQQQVLAEFNGRNHGELAQKFRLSTRTVYRILKRFQQGAQQ